MKGARLFMSGVLLSGLSLFGQPGGGQPASRPTFTKDVAPILQKDCQVCHRPGEAGPSRC
jgi:hypothetical protein